MLEAREAQHVLEGGVEGAGRQAEQVQQPFHVTYAGIAQQFGRAQHAVQRAADLVAHGGQEQRHRAFGGACPFDGPGVFGHVVHQHDPAAVQLLHAVLDETQPDVEAAAPLVGVEPDGREFGAASVENLGQQGLKLRAVVLQGQPVAQGAGFGQPQEGLQGGAVGIEQLTLFGGDEDGAAQPFEHAEILVPFAGQAADAVGQGGLVRLG